jgi:uncharacterized protein (TIGR03437 family)
MSKITSITGTLCALMLVTFLYTPANAQALAPQPPAATTLTVAAAGGAYGGSTTLSAVLSSGDAPVAGETVSFTLNNVTAGTAITSVTGMATLANVSLVGINANSYGAGVGASFSGDSNKSLAAGSGTASLTVTTRTLNVAASAQSKVYDQATSATVTFSDDRVSGDVFTVSSATASFSDPNAGNGKTVTVTGISLSLGAAANYTVAHTTVTATASITPVTPNLSVTSYSGTYDGSPHGVTCTASFPAPRDDSRNPATQRKTLGDSSSSTPSGSCVFIYNDGSAVPVNVGNYSVLVVFVSTNPNYTGATGSSGVMISPAPLTVSATAAKAYGAPLPALVATFSGFVGHDTLSSVTGTPVVSTSATSTSPAGSYPITVSGRLGTPNYTIVFVPGILTISPVVLTVTASGATRLYGAQNTFSYSMSGFVNGDTAAVVSGAPVLSTTASQSSAPGTYPVTMTLGTLSAVSYTFALSSGSLTITPVATDLGLSGITPGCSASFGQAFTLSFVTAPVSGGAMPTGSVIYSVDGGPAQSAELSSGNATVTLASLAIGTHHVLSNYSGDADYQATTPRTTTLTVTALSTQLTIGATPGMTVPQGQPITLTFSLTGTPKPSGTVLYSTDGGAPQVSAVSNGTAIASLNGLEMGPHVVTYSYSGDSDYPALATSTATIKVTTPLPVLTSVVNAADFGVKISAGGLATIFGAGLGTANVSATTLPLPLTLHGTQVFVNGASAPLTFVSPEQINLQIPIGTLVGTPVQVAVVLNGTSSLPVMVTFFNYAPAVFVYSRVPTSTDPVIVHADNSLVTPTAPAQAGEILTIYATGAGALNNAPLDGQPAPASPDATTKSTPSVLVGAAAAAVQFSGLTPGSVGLLQINFQLPAALPVAAGTPHSLPLTINFPAASSAPVNLWVP